MKLHRLFFAVLILLAAFQFCFSQAYWKDFDYISDGVRQPLIIHSSKEEAQILKTRWQAIGEELKTTNNPYAGTYSKFGYRGWYLRWSPSNGFVYIFHSEDIDIIDYSYGKVEVKDSEITFIPEREMKTEFRDVKLKTPKFWISIGSNLISKNEIKDFANYLSGLDKYNNWECDCAAFFSKSSPKNSPKYIIPKQYEHLFKPPIEGKITFVGKPKIIDRNGFGPLFNTPVKVNLGKNQGIKKDFSFRLFFGDGNARKIDIVQVYYSYSIGFITDSWDMKTQKYPTYYDSESNKEKPFPPIRIGTKVTTKLFSY
jgi:hypothetical protein